MVHRNMSTQRPSKISIATLAKMKREGQKIVCITAYDASFAQLEERAGVDVILVGDSLGMVVQGQESTLPVTVDDMIYHCAATKRGIDGAFLVVDMPFMSYNSPAQALENAGRLMKEGGAQMVKVEGGAVQAETVRHLTQHGVPVCAHLGLIPQSVHKLGGYRVQGRDEESAKVMLEDARLLEEAGADMMVVECIPSSLGKALSEQLSIPVIGIGAGVDTDGQVLVVYDMIGLNPYRPPKFCKDFLAQTGNIPDALAAYVEAVRDGSFPGKEHGFE